MSPLADATMPATRRTRKSIGGHIPSSRAFEKENATIDLGGTLESNQRKSRSKSIGPGGLDILKNGSGNRRASLAAPARPPPRSILKPTFSSLPEIPPLKKQRAKPSEDPTQQAWATPDYDGSSDLKVALRTEEEQQAAVREREEKERREARRKSLANRRVSFAAEATLHTFNVIEYMQDSTTSTDSTHRRSSMASASASKPDDNTKQRSFQGQGDEFLPDAHSKETQQRRRRSSAADSHNAYDEMTASSFYSSDSEPADAVEEVQSEENSDSGTSEDSDADDGTMMTVEDHEVTGASVMSAFSVRSNSSPSGSNTLDEALRMASERAGARPVESDDSEGEEMIPSFGWIKKDSRQANDTSLPVTTSHTASHSNDAEEEEEEDEGADMEMDMEMTRAVGGILQQIPSLENQRDDESMDVTKALGGIISESGQSSGNKPGSWHAKRDLSDNDQSVQMDETMEFTKVIGGIQTAAHGHDDDDVNEDMSMEMTAALGGLLAGRRKPSATIKVGNVDDVTADMDMDMTVGIGGILLTTGSDNLDDKTVSGMDMTVGIGRILPFTADDDNVSRTVKEAWPSSERTTAKKLMEQEVDTPDSLSNSLPMGPRSPSRTFVTGDSTQIDSTKDPFRGNGLRHSLPNRDSATPQSSPFRQTPSPAKLPFLPQTRRTSRSPTKSVERRSPARRDSSPMRTPQSQAKSPGRRTRLPDRRPATPSPEKTASHGFDVFRNDPSTGTRTPTVVLTPQSRQLSGVGADRSGIGSPLITAIFDRRESIGEAAKSFVPGSNRGVTFAGAREVEAEVDQDRQEGREGSLNLKQMIESMSPKRKPLQGRKSLHVGSAKGVLGKRPSELDDEEELEDTDGVKRLKGHQGSPVKSIRLQQSPSKMATTGRQSPHNSLHNSEGARQGSAIYDYSKSPERSDRTQTMSHARGQPGKTGDDPTTQLMDLHHDEVGEGMVDSDQFEDKIHLQDFLNMTSIRFMELTTTKRRHTQAPDIFTEGIGQSDGQFPLGRCVIAGACTVPMLELYQHSCRELKKYISEGRRIVREIEAETFEENPPLFREYMSATPEFKSVLDNQFKNGKTHARLESKAMWYEWRMALQTGLKDGLEKIAEGLSEDDMMFRHQEKLLSSIVPELVSRYEFLNEEKTNLETAAQELADCDPAELEGVRVQLGHIESDVDQKRRQIAELKKQLEESAHRVERLSVQKRQCQEETTGWEKIREECRGWSTEEISSLKERVDALEHEHGWAVTRISGTIISMTYKRDIELLFDLKAFGNHQSNSPIDLWKVASKRESSPEPSFALTEFFVQSIRDHVRGMPQRRTKISDLLHSVGTTWDLAVSTSNDIRRINTTFPTVVQRTSNSDLVVTSSLLLKPLQTRVETSLWIQAINRSDGVVLTLNPVAKVVYGEMFNVEKMCDFLSTHMGDSVTSREHDAPSWVSVLVDLHERLLVRGRKE